MKPVLVQKIFRVTLASILGAVVVILIIGVFSTNSGCRIPVGAPIWIGVPAGWEDLPLVVCY